MESCNIVNHGINLLTFDSPREMWHQCWLNECVLYSNACSNVGWRIGRSRQPISQGPQLMGGGFIPTSFDQMTQALLEFISYEDNAAYTHACLAELYQQIGSKSQEK